MECYVSKRVLKIKLVALLLVAAGSCVGGFTRIVKRHSVKYGKALYASSWKANSADFLISSVFSIKPLFKIVSTKARSMIVDQAAAIGVNWADNVQSLESNISQLKTEFQKLESSSISYPEYYLKPFHAYEEGNLSWKAAMEVESASLSVHATVYSTTAKGPKELRRDGDFMLRDNYHRCMLEIFRERSFVPTSILDLGCSTGISTLKLHESFPLTRIIGLDLSPYYLSVANYQLGKMKGTVSSLIEYRHGLAEYTGLAPGEVDLVSICLVGHELPASALLAVIEEAYRVLPVGGAFSLMDMNPRSAAFQRLASNPFAFAAFKSTEPWIQQYVNTDLEHVLAKCGFRSVAVKENSPRHRTVVAYK